MGSSSDPLVLEISSDEDVGSFKDYANFDWLSEFFEKVDKEADVDDDDDDDEVVVLSEVKARSTCKKRPFVDDEDDCLILDGDPDKPVQLSNHATPVNDSAAAGGGFEEELSIVAEKGQLACRDYPHSRHMCATYPFSSTSHSKFCSMCHCYVCDTPAPCIYWGNGVSIDDHCHSTDKEDVWKRQRKSFKQTKKVQPPGRQPAQPPPPQKFRDGSALSTDLPLHKSGAVSQYIGHGNGPLPYALKSHALHACSSTSSYPRPNIIRHNQRSGLTIGRNRLAEAVSRSHPVHVSSNVIRRDRNGTSTLAPHSVNLKRVGGPHSLVSKYSYDNPTTYLAHSQTNQYTPVSSFGDMVGKSLGDLYKLNSYQRVSQPNNVGSGFMDYNASLQPAIYDQSVPQTENTSQQFPNVSSALEQPLSNPEGPLDPAPSTEFDLDLSWIDSLDPELGTAPPDSVASAMSYASHQEELMNEAVLFFDFENS